MLALIASKSQFSATNYTRITPARHCAGFFIVGHLLRIIRKLGRDG
ncbi:hypothetical protein [Orrella marina]|nr:hypothetical protein [Orrella marina]